MVEPSHKQLSIKTQCQLLSISRSGWYYDPKGETPLTLKLMRLIDEQFGATPYYGSRQMARWLRQGVWRGTAPGAAVDGVDELARNLSHRARASLTRAIGFIRISLEIWL